MRHITPSRAGAVVGLLLAIGAISPASAQIVAGPGFTKPQDKPKNEVAPAPALPGARVEKEMVAPPERPASDMQPNDALFDAINRGDIASARDAISRGADLGAKNILGMSPLELSIDLGRNDISFLLISYRDGSGRSAPPKAVADAKPKKPGRPAKTAKADRQDLAVASDGGATPPAADATAKPAAPRVPRLFAGDGGAPVPNAGFLGFGGSPAR